ncbi:DUF1732 domain-containing protein [Candidatus Haliotispira prima]|uniref:DUF1732 domain-containing protein n=1 Tax=Candidatus Haliotispira prima TaxID=3034016 RepID=A0ABY8MK14_9SPIO|nr:DUF1732 domain-containing protein [Candidatus Haliotispira prima]
MAGCCGTEIGNGFSERGKAMIQSLTASVCVSTAESVLPEKLADILHKTFSGTWSIQLRSLNQRFFELNCQVPEFAAELEIPLRKVLQQKLLRGRIECRLSYSAAAEEKSRTGAKLRSGLTFPAPDSELVFSEMRQLLDLQRVAGNLGLELQCPDPLDLLRHCRELQQAWDQAEEQTPFRHRQNEGQDESQEDSPKVGSAAETVWAVTWQQIVLQFCRQACEQLVVVRQREGRELYRELLRLHQAFVGQCKQAHRWEGRIPAYYRRQLREKYRRFQESVQSSSGLQDWPAKPAAANTELREDRLLSELSLFLAKGDVREELSRLCIHARHLFDLLRNACQAGSEPAKPGRESGSCAKELDFLLQEMNREANTLGSKSPVVELQQVAVQMKIIIEQMREQSKNVL